MASAAVIAAALVPSGSGPGSAGPLVDEHPAALGATARTTRKARHTEEKERVRIRDAPPAGASIAESARGMKHLRWRAKITAATVDYAVQGG
jgi:hypothetical protein